MLNGADEDDEYGDEDGIGMPLNPSAGDLN